MKKVILIALVSVFSVLSLNAQKTVSLQPADTSQTTIVAGWEYKVTSLLTKSIIVNLDFSSYGKPVVLKKKFYNKAGEKASNGQKSNPLVEAFFANDSLKVSRVAYSGGTGFVISFKEEVDAKKAQSVIKNIFAENFLEATVRAKDGSISR